MNVRNIALGATVLLLVGTSCGKKDSMGGMLGGNSVPQPYKTEVLSEMDANLETVYPVTIKGKEDIEIKPRIDGFIDAIHVDEGSVVRKGQLLFKINSPQAVQAVASAKAAIASVDAQVSTAQLNIDRIRPLADKGIVSTVQLQSYQNAYAAAMAAKAQAQASLIQAQAMLSWTNVTSPVDGVVGIMPFRQGSLVTNSTILTTVANTSNVFAYFSLNEKSLIEFLSGLEGKTQAEKIKNAPQIKLTMADGTTYSEMGKLETITGVVNVTTGSANFRAEFPNNEGLLRSGASGKITIPRILKNVFVIPQNVTFAQQDKILVYKVQGDSVVQKIISVVSTPDGKNYAVTNGLVKGDRIVVDGIASLNNGKKIIVK